MWVYNNMIAPRKWKASHSVSGTRLYSSLYPLIMMTTRNLLAGMGMSWGRGQPSTFKLMYTPRKLMLIPSACSIQKLDSPLSSWSSQCQCQPVPPQFVVNYTISYFLDYSWRPQRDRGRERERIIHRVGCVWKRILQHYVTLQRTFVLRNGWWVLNAPQE